MPFKTVLGCRVTAFQAQFCLELELPNHVTVSLSWLPSTAANLMPPKLTKELPPKCFQFMDS